MSSGFDRDQLCWLPRSLVGCGRSQFPGGNGYSEPQAVVLLVVGTGAGRGDVAEGWPPDDVRSATCRCVVVLGERGRDPADDAAGPSEPPVTVTITVETSVCTVVAGPAGREAFRSLTVTSWM
ncbi:hypothetical protein [Gandjariella thermophila]|uniref:Uncharacterized protein n=1 Tax=Gandjariella thermophila TaxID=1931992 RepID=A0A4D4J5Y1_9PSEU|nr:hypothetical protein [Gandjariella thermophila]GDY31961.1 hypothetical protein GTS_35940 [Gandjariella thermophila]